MISLNPTALAEFTKDVLAKYPNEACGLVIAGAYHPCTNAHAEPTKYFKITAQERITLSATYGTVDAVLHSHPYSLRGSVHFLQERAEWPSVTDQQAFMNDNVPWGIVSTDGTGVSEINWLTEEEIPLTNRRFSWFTADCYSCIRDWHKQNTKIELPNFTRKWMFWKSNTNTIEEGISKIPSAKRYPADQAIVGDVAVFALGGSRVVNHLGVITGSNEMLHQFAGAADGPGMYAHTTRWDMWRKKAKYVVRFEVPNAT